MRRPLEIKAEEASVRSVVSLTSALESLSSMQIAKTKNKVLISNQFFDEVWNIYKQIRVDVLFNFGRAPGETPIDKELLILITAKGGLSGDIDQRLIRKVIAHYDEAKNDVRSPEPRFISTNDSPIKIAVIPTDEEQEIADQTLALVAKK